MATQLQEGHRMMGTCRNCVLGHHKQCLGYIGTNSRIGTLHIVCSCKVCEYKKAIDNE